MRIRSMKLVPIMVAFAVCVTVMLGIPRSSNAEQKQAGNTESQRLENGDSSRPPKGIVGKIQFIHPKVKEYGRVVQLSNAVEQPRAGSKICVDITSGGSPDEMNSAIRKVARFVNIYAGAGHQSATVRITVILHGDATLCALDSEAYAKKFQTQGNPNIALLKLLQKSGVDFCVCGQSLASKGFSARDVTSEVNVAVSALTALVNRQIDGFAYVPLLK